MLNEAGGKVRVQDDVRLLPETGLSLYGRGWIGCVPGGTLISKGHIEQSS